MLLAVVVSSSSGAQRLVFDKVEITFGRVQGNDVVLPYGNVSRRHARIVVRDDKVILVDLKSTNGTFVNGRRLISPLVISEHDRIAIGDFQITVEEEDAPTLRWAPAPLLDPVEERLLASIAARDHASRVVYADWLEERGELARAEFLRIQDQLIGSSPDDPGFRAGRERLEELARGLDLDWRFAVGRPAIEGCLSFELACPKEWGSLAPTGRANLRFCETCEQAVYYCEEIEQARAYARGGNCVAVDIAVPRLPDDLDATPMIRMGRPVPR